MLFMPPPFCLLSLLTLASVGAGPAEADKEAPLYKGKPPAYWVEQLADRDSKARLEAVEAIRVLGPQAKAGVPRLLRALEDDTSAIRLGAIRALGAIGPEAKAAVPTLAEMLNDRDLEYCTAAINALGRIGPEARAALPELRRLQHDDRAAVRHAAVEAVGRIGRGDREAIAAVAQVARNRTLPNFDRVTAIKALGAAGPEAVPALVDLLKQDEGLHSDFFHVETIRALEQIGPEAVPALLDVLAKWKGSLLRQQVVRALGRMGPAAKAALPALVETMRENNETGAVASEAVAQLGSDALPLLIKLLGEKGIRRERALAALTRMGPKAEAAVPDLVSLLGDDDPETRKQARQALVALGPAVVPALLEALQDQGSVEAAATLGKLGSGAKSAVPGLIRILQGGDPGRRMLAASTLGEIGSEAKAAVPALTEAKNDRRPEVVRAATAALVRIQGKP